MYSAFPLFLEMVIMDDHITIWENCQLPLGRATCAAVEHKEVCNSLIAIIPQPQSKPQTPADRLQSFPHNNNESLFVYSEHNLEEKALQGPFTHSVP
jgi:hypothetical protein